jgi:hypothetical protein
MSTFSHFFGAARAQMQKHLASAVTWTKPGAAAVPIDVIVGPESLDLQQGDTGTVRQRQLSVQILEADVANPTRGDVCTVGEVEWSFSAVEWRQNGYIGVRLCRPEKVEISGRSYRK